MTALPRVRVVVSLAGARSRLARFMTGSMAVHGVLLVAILIVPATRHRPPLIEDTMVVALAGPIGGAPAPRSGATAPKAEPAPPKPEPPPKEAHAVREVPVPKPKDKEKEKEKPVKPKPLVKFDDTPAPPTPETGPKAGTPGPPQPGPESGKPAAGAGAVTASVGGGDSSLGWYGAAVKAALESVWAKPYLEDAVGTASVVVGFDIARDGTTRNLRIVQSSGIPSLDRSAMRAVIEASPLPAVPPAWTEDTIPVTMRFDLTPEAR
jgi:periplasmic protein TonB